VYLRASQPYYDRRALKMNYKSYINKYWMVYDWLTGIILLLATSVDISLLKNFLKEMQSIYYMPM
jgi:hypothetical protein